MNPFILAAIEWICGFLAGAATVHCINYRRRHADKRSPSEEDIRAITASVMQTIDSTPCGDPDCPVCHAVMALAAEDGRCAKLDNVPRDQNPYPPFSVEHIAWNEGYDGQ